MKKAILYVFAVIGALAVLTMGVGVLMAACSGLSKGSIDDATILELDLEREVAEVAPDNPFDEMFGRKALSVRDIVDALERAGDDERVAALVVRFGSTSLGLAKIQEIRDAVIRFRAKKKKAIVFSETLGEFGPANASYYLATAFDEIWLQPTGEVGLTGLMVEAPFIAGTLEKVGLKMRGDQRSEYKNAFNFYTEKKFTEAHKEATKHLAESFMSQMVRGIAKGRGLSEEEVRALIDRGPFLAPEALEAKLVDGLGYRDEVFGTLKKEAGEDAKLLYLSKYLKRAGRPHRRGEVIALIYGVGEIRRGRSQQDPLAGSARFGSDTVAGAFRAAVEDEDVKAIVFRVDSPGGSAVASDVVWREIGRARAKGRPVIVSMSDVAGSGGYYVAMGADKIVAQPGTITGSIGVFGGKFLTSPVWDKIGVTWDELRFGKNAGIWTGRADYNEAEWARFQATLDKIYEDFTAKVAEGRKLPKEKVLEIAKGRVWTGEDAKQLGLVDELGGFPKALALAREAAKIPRDRKVKIKVFPKPKGPFAELFGEAPENSEHGDEREVSVEGLQHLRAALKAGRRLGLGRAQGPLVMPEPLPLVR